MMTSLKKAFSATLFLLSPWRFFDSWTYVTARRVFIELLTSAEAYVFTESDLLTFSSLQVLISLIFEENS